MLNRGRKNQHLYLFVRFETGVDCMFPTFSNQFHLFSVQLHSFCAQFHSCSVRVYPFWQSFRFFNHSQSLCWSVWSKRAISLWPRKRVQSATTPRRSLLALISVSVRSSKSGRVSFPSQLPRYRRCDSHEDEWWISSCIPMFGLVNLSFWVILNRTDVGVTEFQTQQVDDAKRYHQVGDLISRHGSERILIWQINNGSSYLSYLVLNESMRMKPTYFCLCQAVCTLW